LSVNLNKVVTVVTAKGIPTTKKVASARDVKQTANTRFEYNR